MVMNRLLAGMHIQVVANVAAGRLVVWFVFEHFLLFSFYVYRHIVWFAVTPGLKCFKRDVDVFWMWMLFGFFLWYVGVTNNVQCLLSSEVMLWLCYWSLLLYLRSEVMLRYWSLLLSNLAIRGNATLLIFASTLAIRSDATLLIYAARIWRSWSSSVNCFTIRCDFLRMKTVFRTE